MGIIEAIIDDAKRQYIEIGKEEGIKIGKWKKLNKMSHNAKYFFRLRIFWKPHIALATACPEPRFGIRISKDS